MKCQIISIGDELLIGDTVNTNASWLGGTLAGQGVEVTRVHTIGDGAGVIRSVIRQAMDEAGLVITTGGLGPTHDDITKKTVADIFQAEMTVHEPTLHAIKKAFKKRNIPFTASNYRQAEVPDNCEVLMNRRGTAPGLWFEREGSRLAVLPGIPREMQALVTEEVIPRIRELTNGTDRAFARHIKVAGVGESTLSDQLLGPLDDYLGEDISVAFLPSPQANTIRVTARAASRRQAESRSRALVDFIYERADNFIIGEGKDLSLSKAVGRVLREHKQTIAVAESCTGGLLADTLTDTPGSSDYMLGGIVAYANRVKQELLGVPEAMLTQHGAVSKPVALQMARAAAARLGSDIGVSTTGIAGPGGGTPQKPVGRVWIGFWSENAHFALRSTFTDDRRLNKERSVAVALETVRRVVLSIETMPYDLKPHHA